MYHVSMESETRVEVWENEKCCENMNHGLVFPQHTYTAFLSSPRLSLSIKQLDYELEISIA